MHHGQKLAQIFEAKGLKQNAVAELIGVSKQTVHKDVHADTISRDALGKYTGPLNFTLTEFYDDAPISVPQREQVSAWDLLKVKDQLIDELRKRLDLQDQLLNFTKAGNSVNNLLPR
ncbi:helix-turn-helix domain-containing protein [Fibrella aquatilis]|uniref:Helix-turn-helix transcriptional regulator n=1 Tax=Fibrella aquatilis TaxID=2817059 RepID=A0A939K2Z2_9BACT|nr:helix-turn-helix transcriptional regulator [Fibrella aquatilis]MBO0934586.1 helix-turn-helix transcriptional regulator [Fibrella aquatilis]